MPTPTPAPPNPTRILIVAPAWVGDMVMAHALVQVLAASTPGAEIHMVAPPATAPLADRMPAVARSHVLAVGHGELGLGRRLSLARELRSLNFHQALVLPNTFKSALLPWWAGIPTRTGWHGESRYALLNDRRRLDETRYPLMIERFMALAYAPGAEMRQPYPVPALTVDAANRQRLMEELDLSTEGGVLALCPGAEFGPAKRWPAEHYAAVARHGAAAGRSVWLLGSPNDAPVCAEVKALAPAARDLSGRTRLVDAVDLLSAAVTVVCNDSGLMHVACAVGAPVVALFGSTSPAFTPPLGGRATVLRQSLPCSPCFQRHCPLGHLACLRDLHPEQVIEALR